VAYSTLHITTNLIATLIYTLSLHDALPILDANRRVARRRACFIPAPEMRSCSAVSWRRCLAGGLALLALDVACRRVAPPLAWHTEAGYRWRELRVLSSGGPAFSELTPSRTGIRFTNTVNLDSALWNRHLAQGGGVALGDVDGDGLPDVYLTSNEGANALYRNLGDWHFED